MQLINLQTLMSLVVFCVLWNAAFIISINKFIAKYRNCNETTGTLLGHYLMVAQASMQITILSKQNQRL